MFIDSPVTNSLQLVYGGGSFRKYSYSGRIENVGVENIRGESDYASDTNKAQSWDFVTVNKAQNCWVSGTQARYFAYSLVTFDSDAKWCTATNNVSLLPKSVITGGRRYTYNINGQQNLVENSTADNGRHDFVLGSTTPGPNVFYNCTATNEHADAGPHHRYSTGALFDNITDLQGEINVQNRWNSGTGHGWAGANMVIWNATPNAFVVQEVINTAGATVAENWIIGSKGTMKSGEFAKPSGVVFPTIPLANNAQYSPKYDDSHGTNVATQSLYQAQLADATGQTNKTYQWTSGSGNWGDAQKWVQAAIPRVRGIQMRDYLIGDIDTFTYDANADDDYYIDPAFKTQVQSQFGSNVGGFDVVAANRNLAFTHQFALAANEQILNASLALGMRSVSGSSSNDMIMIDSAGTFSLNTLGWTRSVGTTTVGMFDLGPYLAAMQNGKLSVAFNGNTAADWGLMSLQVGVDTPDAQVTLSGGGTVTVNSAVPAVSSVTINGTSTMLEIVNGGQLAVKDVTSQGLLRVSGGTLSVSGIMDNNSRVTIAGGTLIAGSSTALGSTNAVGTTITSGTLDVNGQNLTTEPITVQGAGVGNNGAIVNSGVTTNQRINIGHTQRRHDFRRHPNSARRHRIRPLGHPRHFGQPQHRRPCV